MITLKTIQLLIHSNVKYSRAFSVRNRPEADLVGKKNSPMNSGYFFASKNYPVLATA